MLTILKFVFDSESTNDGQVLIMGLFVLLLPLIIPLFVLSLYLLFSPILLPLLLRENLVQKNGSVTGGAIWLVVIAIGMVIFYFFGDYIIPFYSKALQILFVGK